MTGFSSTATIDVMVQGADEARVADLLLQKLQHLVRQPQPFAAPMGMPAAPVQHYREEIPGLTQAKLCMLFTAGDNPNPPSVSILRVAMSVLGGSATSRLFRNVREKQSLCYYCGSAAQRATGVMMIDSGVEPGREEQAEAAILAEWEALKNGPITQEEVDDCRRSLLSGMDALGGQPGCAGELVLRPDHPGRAALPHRNTARCSPALCRWTRCARPCRVTAIRSAMPSRPNPAPRGKEAPKMSNNERFAAAQARAAAAVSCEKVVLPSGLTVLCRTMPGYSSVHAIYATAFGSIHRQFTLDGKPVSLPAGTAHFLEHKMCETPQGDSFSFYAKTGASANAFTSYDRTCYIFSATQKIEENLDILLGLVANPGSPRRPSPRSRASSARRSRCTTTAPTGGCSTPCSAACTRPPPAGRYRRYGGQHRHADAPAALQLHPGLLCTLQHGAVGGGQDHAGPGGGSLQAQRPLPCPPGAPGGMGDPGGNGPHSPQGGAFHHAGEQALLGVAYREPPLAHGDLKRELLLDMLGDLVAGGLTNLYRKLYDEALVNPEFSGDFLAVQGACAVAFTGESEEPRKVTEMLQAEIERMRTEGIDPELFLLVKNQMYGELLGDVETVDDAAEEAAAACLKGRTLADEIAALAELTVEDANALMQTALREENRAYVQIDPQ